MPPKVFQSDAACFALDRPTIFEPLVGVCVSHCGTAVATTTPESNKLVYRDKTQRYGLRQPRFRETAKVGQTASFAGLQRGTMLMSLLEVRSQTCPPRNFFGALQPCMFQKHKNRTQLTGTLEEGINAAGDSCGTEVRAGQCPL